MPKRSPQEQALHQAQQPIYEALVLRKEIADLKRKLSDSIAREQEIERELEDQTVAHDHYREQYLDANKELHSLRAHADALAGAWEELRHDMYQRAAMRKGSIDRDGTVKMPIGATVLRNMDEAADAYRQFKEPGE